MNNVNLKKNVFTALLSVPRFIVATLPWCFETESTNLNKSGLEVVRNKYSVQWENGASKFLLLGKSASLVVLNL